MSNLTGSRQIPVYKSKIYVIWKKLWKKKSFRIHKTWRLLTCRTWGSSSCTRRGTCGPTMIRTRGTCSSTPTTQSSSSARSFRTSVALGSCSSGTELYKTLLLVYTKPLIIVLCECRWGCGGRVPYICKDLLWPLRHWILIHYLKCCFDRCEQNTLYVKVVGCEKVKNQRTYLVVTYAHELGLTAKKGNTKLSVFTSAHIEYLCCGL